MEKPPLCRIKMATPSSHGARGYSVTPGILHWVTTHGLDGLVFSVFHKDKPQMIQSQICKAIHLWIYCIARNQSIGSVANQLTLRKLAPQSGGKSRNPLQFGVNTHKTIKQTMVSWRNILQFPLISRAGAGTRLADLRASGHRWLSWVPPVGCRLPCQPLSRRGSCCCLDDDEAYLTDLFLFFQTPCWMQLMCVFVFGGQDYRVVKKELRSYEHVYISA